ncbi:MAG: YdeI/OmpD-associated family protein [Chloroflexota bacterium]|nr:YdeI/OmpD-associated family protein [Chloroflexota bacterium]
MAQAEQAEERETFQANSRAAWRGWLERNHERPDGIWLVSYKKASGKPGVSYPEAVEEALCFGWIDSRPNALDDERYMQYFSPRKPKSPWSAVNKRRIEDLIERGLMTPAGMAKIEAAKRDGSWGAYDAIERLEIPDDLAAALRASPDADANFRAFGDSTKKQILWWIASAKRPETRATRIARTVEAAAEKRNPIAYERKKT